MRTDNLATMVMVTKPSDELVDVLSRSKRIGDSSRRKIASTKRIARHGYDVLFGAKFSAANATDGISVASNSTPGARRPWSSGTSLSKTASWNS